MLVDRPTAGASLRRRALVWAACMFGMGIVVLAAQQLLAEPAGADTPGLVDTAVDGAVATVDQVADPVPAPEAELPLVEPLAPVVEPVAQAAQPLTPTVEAAAPVVEAAAPVVEAAAPVVVPVVEAAAPLVTPVAEAAAPVLEAVVPVVDPVVRALPPVLEVVGPVVAPVGGLAGPSVDSVTGMGPGPPGGPAELTPSSADAHRPGAPTARRSMAPTGVTSANVPMLGSTPSTAAGEGGSRNGVPSGALPWAAPPGGSGAPGESRSGGAGPSSLMAVLAGDLLGPGPTPGDVVHDRAARLTTLVHGPGCLPG